MTLDEMKGIDIRTVDKTSLIDLKTVKFSSVNDDPREKIEDLKRQLKNLYAYRVGDVAVYSVYSDSDMTINDAFAVLLASSL